jgi:hypothetical protein
MDQNGVLIHNIISFCVRTGWLKLEFKSSGLKKKLLFGKTFLTVRQTIELKLSNFLLRKYNIEVLFL